MDLTNFFEKAIGYFKSAWRFRWWGLLMATLFTFLGWTVVALMPDHYRAQAKVYIDTTSLLQPLMRDISIPMDPESRIHKMTKMILSRPNLERIAQMSDLDLEYNTSIEKDAFLTRMEHDIQFEQMRNSNLFHLSYYNPNPKVAKLVVQSVLSLFMELTLSDTRTDTVVAQKFIEDQIRQYEQKLINAEQKLAEFKRDHIDHLPREDRTYYESLQKMIAHKEETEMFLAAAESKEQSLNDQLRGETPVLGLVDQEMTALHPLARKQKELEDALHRARQYYTDKHPDVVRMLKQIGNVQEQIKLEEEVQNASWAYSADELNQSPVFQQLKIQLAQAKADVAALKAQRDEIARHVQTMEAKVDQIIDAETKLSNLNRDYSMNKAQYNALLEKRDAAKLVEDIDGTSENLTFRIIEPPYASSLPVWPKRKLFNFVVLMASLLGGIASTFVMAQWKPAFYDKSSLEKSLGLPVLAIIPQEQNLAKRKLSLKLNLLYATCILGLWGGLMILYYIQRQGVIPT